MQMSEFMHRREKWKFQWHRWRLRLPSSTRGHDQSCTGERRERVSAKVIIIIKQRATRSVLRKPPSWCYFLGRWGFALAGKCLMAQSRAPFRLCFIVLFLLLASSGADARCTPESKLSVKCLKRKSHAANVQCPMFNFFYFYWQVFLVW